MDNNELKRKALEKFFERANDMQKKAIFKTDGAVLIIAGAGSGKTTVLCNRIANLLLFGDAYHCPAAPELSADDVKFIEAYIAGTFGSTPEVTAWLSSHLGHDRAVPWKILAVTFTNKAAKELKTRLENMNAPGAADVWASTFHSTCVRILRRSIECVGYQKNFVIYDTDDSKRVIKSVLEAMNLSDKSFPPKTLMGAISAAKDKLITPENYPVTNEKGEKDYMLGIIRDVYRDYQARLRAANALDFDDIIMKTVEVFRTSSAELEYWQSHFDYIMVDEYQDTNRAQYELVKLLAGGKGNLCVVGDEDQSIYRFRGATIENILSFEDEFESAVIKLEQNYRSTSNILDAANAVIRNNTQHKDKNLWSDLGEGEKIQVLRFSDDRAEVQFVGNDIMNRTKDGAKFSDHAILYRNNAQSQSFELALGKMGVPYVIVGGTKFYDRKEIRDMIAYLSVVSNPNDAVRLGRIINEPKRGIGDTTWAEIQNVANACGISPVEVMERSEEFASLTKKAKLLKPVAGMFRELIDTAEERELTDILDDILEQSGYREMLMLQGEEGMGRLENINELKSSMISFAEDNPESHSLFDFLEQVALISDIDKYDDSQDRVTLMTMHAAKGLEFENVYIVGAEENIFPSYRSLADMYELEEDRRLCYVAITRAKKRLFITTAEQRLLYGQTQHNKVSRFINEIPSQYVEVSDKTARAAAMNERTYGGRKQSTYLQDITAAKAAKPASAPSGAPQSFSAGDRVKHRKFGEGTVVSASPLGKDTLLEISFDEGGTKKLAAAFAKIEKL
ncbi:MAG: UvrD-helicase domain-containing protein [Ruminiclostridium sp.]|nr:UvrD-helicase domain-containing protein [Ruminiclostridium sp.]